MIWIVLLHFICWLFLIRFVYYLQVTTQLTFYLIQNPFICKYIFVFVGERSFINWIQENTIISNKFIFSFSLFSRRSTKRFRLKVNCNYNINTQQRINKKRGKMSPKNGAFFQISFSVCFSSCLTHFTG